jgi:hypothetical protein
LVWYGGIKAVSPVAARDIMSGIVAKGKNKYQRTNIKNTEQKYKTGAVAKEIRDFEKLTIAWLYDLCYFISVS